MKKFLVFVLLLTIFGLTGCSHIEDTNGEDDYSITTITDQDIIDGMNNLWVGSISSSKKIDGKTTGTLKVNKFSGVSEIAEFISKNTLILMTISNTCTAGNLMVVVTSEDEILLKVYANESKSVEIPNNGKKYQIKVVGESAKFSLEYSFK